MKVIDNLKSKSVDEFAEWLDTNCHSEYAPWIQWWNDNYCYKCPSEIGKYEDSDREIEFCWCELNDNKCKLFPDMNSTPDSKQVIKMWLESELEI